MLPKAAPDHSTIFDSAGVARHSPRRLRAPGRTRPAGRIAATMLGGFPASSLASVRLLNMDDGELRGPALQIHQRRPCFVPSVTVSALDTEVVRLAVHSRPAGHRGRDE